MDMGISGLLLLALVGPARAQPIGVRIPEGSTPAEWAGAAARVGLVLQEEPGCPGVVILERGGMWEVRVCRGAAWLAEEVPIGRSQEDRERALVEASRLLLLPVDSAVFQASIAAEAPAGSDRAGGRAAWLAVLAELAGPVQAEPERAPVEGQVAVAGPAELSGPLSEALPGALRLERLPAAGPWLQLGGGLRLRGQSTAAAGVLIAGGWAWLAGLSAGLSAGLDRPSSLTPAALGALGGGYRDAELAAELGWRVRPPLKLAAAAGATARQLRQGERSEPAAAIPWASLGVSLALEEGALRVCPSASLRLETRQTALRVDGQQVGVLPPLSARLGLSFRLE